MKHLLIAMISFSAFSMPIDKLSWKNKAQEIVQNLKGSDVVSYFNEDGDLECFKLEGDFRSKVNCPTISEIKLSLSNIKTKMRSERKREIDYSKRSADIIGRLRSGEISKDEIELLLLKLISEIKEIKKDIK